MTPIELTFAKYLGWKAIESVCKTGSPLCTPLDQVAPKVLKQIQIPVRYLLAKLPDFSSDDPINYPDIFTHALGEELIFHLGIQTIALLCLAKIMPTKIRPLFEHKWVRIATTSALFVCAHKGSWSNRGDAITHMMMSMIDGYATESYGIHYAVLQHFAWNSIVRVRRHTLLNQLLKTQVASNSPLRYLRY